MSEDINNSVLRGMQILECLFDDGFQGKTEKDISKQTHIPLTTVFRILKTLESSGWLIEKPISGSKLKVWKISIKIVEIAHSYELNALKQVQQIKAEHLKVTGKELNA